jgi:hypothetical protein
MDAAGIVETDRKAIKDVDLDSCAVADGTADQQETHATVPDIVERQWLRILCVRQLFTTISYFPWPANPSFRHLSRSFARLVLWSLHSNLLSDY